MTLRTRRGARRPLSVFCQAALLLCAGCAGTAAPPPEPAAAAPDTAPDVAPEAVSEAPVPEFPEIVVPDGLLDDRLAPDKPVTAHVPEPWPFDVRHYDIAVAPDFEKQSLAGRVTVRLRATTDDQRVVALDAVDLDIERVAGEDDRELAYHLDGDRLVIDADAPLPRERDWTCTVTYTARHPVGGVYFNLPSPGEFDAPRQVYTQGECVDTRRWMPCHDAPDDRATHSISVTVPSEMAVVAAGRQTGREDAGDGLSTWSFAMDTPHVSYLITFAAGDYVISSHPGVVPLIYAVERRDAGLVAENLRDTDDVLRFLGDYTGRPYPYAKYAQTLVRHFDFGGMENISATTLTDRTIHPADWEPAKESMGLVAHEAAHQWFGDLVTCSDWAHIWLNEGFATYGDLLHTEHARGPLEFALALRGTRRGALDMFDKDRRPIVSNRYADPFDLFDGHAYAGGAFRLHMLRSELGDQLFRDVVRAWIGRQAGTVVTTADFVRVASDVAGRDLAPWFAQWVTGPGYPSLKLSTTFDAAAGVTRLQLEQTQKTGGKVPAAFHFPLTVVLQDAAGAATRHTVEVTERSQSFDLKTATAPVRIVADPDVTLFARMDVGATTADHAALVSSELSPAVRADAMEALGKVLANGKAPAEEHETARAALAGALLHEQLPALRATLLRELGKDRGAETLATLRAHLSPDEDLRERIAAIETLGEWKGHADACAALDALCADHNELIRATALRAAAKARSKAARAALEAALEEPGYASNVRVAALDGLAELGGEGVDTLLFDQGGPEFDVDTRVAAFRGLHRVGKDRPGVQHYLALGLRANHRRLRGEAAESLGKLGDPAALAPLVEALRAERWPRVKKALREAIKKCRKAAADAGEPLSVEVFRGIELRKRHAALAARLSEAEKRAKDDPEAVALRKRMAPLKHELDALGIGLPPAPPPPAAPATAPQSDQTPR